MIKLDSLIKCCVLDIISSLPDPVNIDAESTILYGKSGIFDSLSLVALIISIEQAVESELGVQLILANDRAFSMKQSPFSTLNKLIHYVEEEIKGAQHGH